jgi:hypothetical protein
VTAGPALMAASAQAATAAPAAKAAAAAGTSGAGPAAAASHGHKGNGSGNGDACTTAVVIEDLGYYNICFRIDGQGLHIEKATAWVVNHTPLFPGPIMHFEITGPAGHIANCDQFRTDGFGGRSPDCSWEPHADVPAGRYCTKLWRLNGNAHWNQVGINTCIDVKA